MVEEKEKTTDIAKDAFNRLSEGKSTINDVREEFGLNPIQDGSFNQKIVTKELSGQQNERRRHLLRLINSNFSEDMAVQLTYKE